MVVLYPKHFNKEEFYNALLFLVKSCHIRSFSLELILNYTFYKTA